LALKNATQSALTAACAAALVAAGLDAGGVAGELLLPHAVTAASAAVLAAIR
jgi:hypothetical protein